MRRFMRAKEVVAVTGVGRSTIHAWVAEGKFPAPVKLREGGRASGWYEDEVNEFIRNGRSNIVEAGNTKMTMRDHFAMHADIPQDIRIQTAYELSGISPPDDINDHIGWVKFWAAAEASMRYIKADAMLNARSIDAKQRAD